MSVPSPRLFRGYDQNPDSFYPAGRLPDGRGREDAGTCSVGPSSEHCCAYGGVHRGAHAEHVHRGGLVVLVCGYFVCQDGRC